MGPWRAAIHGLTSAILRSGKAIRFQIPKNVPGFKLSDNLQVLKGMLRSGIMAGKDKIVFIKSHGNAVWESGEAVIKAGDGVVKGTAMYYRKGRSLVIQAGGAWKEHLDAAERIAKAIDIRNIPFDISVRDMRGIAVMRYNNAPSEEKQSFLEEFKDFMRRQVESMYMLPEGSLDGSRRPEA